MSSRESGWSSARLRGMSSRITRALVLWLGLSAGCTTPTAQTPAGAGPPAVATAAVPTSGAPARARWRVGTTGDYAPFSTRAADGSPEGFDIELAQAMADDLNADIEWVGVTWPTLTSAIQTDRFDVAMTGVTWQPARGVIGYLTRSVARGGPCVLGDHEGTPVAVNRGGVLEKWARSRWTEPQLITVDDNQSLPGLLATGRVRAIVTDSFELRAFARPGWESTCEPRLTRKVYWIAPGHEALGRAIDGWLESHPERVHAAQERWFGERHPLRPIDHVSDLLARRLAFMPLVAGAKAKAGLPIENLPRERQVLDASAASARRLQLPEDKVRAFLALQIELAKAVQRRKTEDTTLDLATDLRTALDALGERLIDALAAAQRAGQLRAATLADLEPTTPFLEPAEREQLLAALHALAG